MIPLAIGLPCAVMFVASPRHSQALSGTLRPLQVPAVTPSPVLIQHSSAIAPLPVNPLRVKFIWRKIVHDDLMARASLGGLISSAAQGGTVVKAKESHPSGAIRSIVLTGEHVRGTSSQRGHTSSRSSATSMSLEHDLTLKFKGCLAWVVVLGRFASRVCLGWVVLEAFGLFAGGEQWLNCLWFRRFN